MITGNRALLMLIAARFSGSGSGKDLLSRATSLIAFGLPFSISRRDSPACKIPCAGRGMAHMAKAGHVCFRPFRLAVPIGSTMAPFPRSPAS